MSPRRIFGEKRRSNRPVARSLATLASVLLIYYAFPIGWNPQPIWVALTLLGMLTGVGALAWLIVVQLRRYLADPDDPTVRVNSLASIFYVFVVVFAGAYLLVARASEEQFTDLATKTDALYFTISTLATVGFGDVVATGQLARAMVIIQMVFDLVFIATLGTIISGVLQRRAPERFKGAPAAGRTGESRDVAADGDTGNPGSGAGNPGDAIGDSGGGSGNPGSRTGDSGGGTGDPGGHR